jgi:hypothetical protein
MTLNVRLHPLGDLASYDRDSLVRLGRGNDCDVRVGHERVQGRWTVSKVHAEIRWDGSRWGTLNVSDKAGLLLVYEPGYEEVPLESGRVWVPVRHRWSYSVGRPGHQFHVVCDTNDHRGPAGMAGRSGPAGMAGRSGPVGTAGQPGPVGAAGRSAATEGHASGYFDEEPTAGIESVLALSLTPLELDVLLSYYSDFTFLPRPPTLEPRSHDKAARRLGRSVDSTRKAIERVNDKIGRFDGAPAIASGRNVSAEIGRWLARSGALDPRP